MQGNIPDKEWEHDPMIRDQHFMTAAMLMAFEKIIPPKQWEHNPKVIN